MRLLITGASGFLGGHLLSYLGTIPEVTPILLSRSPHPGSYMSVSFHSLSGGVDRILEKVSFDAVVHCAALSDAYECEIHPQEAYAVNRDLSRELAEVAASRKAPFCFISTDLVFDGSKPKEGGFVESDVPAPLSQYARSKFEGEQAVNEAHPEALIFRSSLLYGPSLGGRGGFLGWIHSGLSAGEGVVLFEDEWRTPLFVQDLCKLIFEGVSTSKRGIYHCAGPKSLTRYEFGVLYANHFGFDQTLIKRGRRSEAGSIPSRPEDVSLSIHKILREFSTPPHSPVEAFSLMDEGA